MRSAGGMGEFHRLVMKKKKFCFFTLITISNNCVFCLSKK